MTRHDCVINYAIVHIYQVAYTNAGVANTSCDVSWPSGVPVPIEPMGFTATNDVVAIGVATMQTSTSQQSANCIVTGKH